MSDLTITRCECGAITVDKDGNSQCVMEDRLDEFFPGYQVTEDNIFVNCNHCINHWGVDICACGSGEAPEECANNFDCCGVPVEYPREKKERPLWGS